MRRPFQVKDRAMVSAFIALAALSILTIAGPAWAQMVNWADTARKGHDWRQSLVRIATRWRSINADVLEHFTITTRRSVDHPTSMPNPYLLEYQVQEVVTYILSLRK